MADEQIIDPHVVTFTRENQQLHVIVVGAGGIGGRVIPAIAKLLRQGDVISVVDGDRVEDRNVFRQHFCQEDVGLHKAEVMQSRYHTDRVPVRAMCQMLHPNLGLNVAGLREESLPIVLGCVDTRNARRTILEYLDRYHRWIYIDGGNDRRSGQVLMGWNALEVRYKGEARNTCLSVKDAMPQVFDGVDDDEADGESCGMRVDPQTMNVNNMAAAVMINALALLTTGLPLSTCGWIFSTFNSIIPIEITGYGVDSWSGERRFRASQKYRVVPDAPAPAPSVHTGKTAGISYTITNT